MNLESLSYLLALAAIVAVVGRIAGATARQALLLAASWAFYASWEPAFLGILVLSTAVNWLCGRALERKPSAPRLACGVGFNLALLFAFKYLPDVSPLASWAMPVGISFWTFQALSYLFDCYREERLAPTPLEFALYLAFWPTVLSGPVTRLADLLPQLRATQAPAADDLPEGVRRILFGLFMKLFLADLLARGFADGEGIAPGFDQLASGWGGVDVWVLAVGYGFQLFFDFAGYSHIAIGSARLVGVRLPENFDRPYLAPTPAVFWTRWHMSLSFWIRDYLFLPLAMVHRANAWRYFVLAFSMVVFGLWHGATASFLLWGAWHGVLLVAHRLIQAWGRRHGGFPAWLAGPLGWGLTFAAVNLGWLLFRAPSTGQALAMLRTALDPRAYSTLALRPNVYIVTLLVVAAYFAFETARRALTGMEHARSAFAFWLEPVFWSALILLTICWSAQETGFVYFQF